MRIVAVAVFAVSAALAGCAGMNLKPAASEADADAWSKQVKQGMTMDEVSRLLGPPDERTRFPLSGEDVLGWWYHEFGDRRMFFNAHFDAGTGRLKYTSRSVDPAWSASQTDGDTPP